MMPFALQHVLESTLFCAVLFVICRCFIKGAAARHAIGLVAVSKFVIPSLLLAPAGARLALFWPAAPWVSSLVNRVSAAWADVAAIFPASVPPRTAAVLGCIWAAGTAATAAAWCLRLKESRRAFLPATGAEELLLAEARQLLRVPLAVRVACSSTGCGPALHGIWRPFITLPKGLSKELSREEVKAVLLHELAHARRFDNLAAAFVRAVACIFWFHPLVWFVEGWLRGERERSCDELVLANGVNPRIYASGILKVCRFHVLGTAAGVSAVSSSDLKRRIESILEGRTQSSSYAPPVLLAALALPITLVPLAGGYCSQCVSNGQPAHSMVRASR